MYKSIILPLAKEDVTEAAKWYNKQQKDWVKDLPQRSGTKSILSGKIPKFSMYAIIM